MCSRRRECNATSSFACTPKISIRLNAAANLRVDDDWIAWATDIGRAEVNLQRLVVLDPEIEHERRYISAGIGNWESKGEGF